MKLTFRELFFDVVLVLALVSLPIIFDIFVSDSAANNDLKKTAHCESIQIKKQEVKKDEELPRHEQSDEEKSTIPARKQNEQRGKRETRETDEPREKPTSRNSRQVKIDGVLMTFYTANCKGCTGFTRWGEYDVRNTVYYNGMRIIATDPSLIPPYSIVGFELNGEYIKAIALDTGGAIKGKRIDFLVESKEEAIQLGKKYVDVEIIRKGKQND